MEVAVADVAHDRGRQPLLGDVGLRGGDAVGQRGDRDADVGGQAGASGPQRAGGVVGAVARAPQLPALALVCGPGEVAAAVLGGDLGRLPRLGADVVLGGAVELQEQARRDRVVGLVIAVDGLDLQLVDELDPRDRDRVLPDPDDALDRGCSDGNVQRAATVASGIGCRRSVASQISPSVPSEPIISRVRS